VQIQAPVGLTAYLPSVLPARKPPAAPDEIALVFYREGDSEADNTYNLAKTTVGGRAYSDLHALVFDLERSVSGFPERFSGSLQPKGRYYLFDTPIDWQQGRTDVFVGVRGKRNHREFFGVVAAWLQMVQKVRGPDGAIVAASPDFDYLVYWEHWPTEADAKDSQIPRLAELVDTVYQRSIPPYPLHEGLWTSYEGVEIKGGESFNFQFERREPNF
jgi:hypothetical protein